MLVSYVVFYKQHFQALGKVGKLNDLFRFMNYIDVIFTSASSVTENRT